MKNHLNQKQTKANDVKKDIPKVNLKKKIDETSSPIKLKSPSKIQKDISSKINSIVQDILPQKNFESFLNRTMEKSGSANILSNKKLNQKKESYDLQDKSLLNESNSINLINNYTPSNTEGDFQEIINRFGFDKFLNDKSAVKTAGNDVQTKDKGLFGKKDHFVIKNLYDKDKSKSFDIEKNLEGFLEEIQEKFIKYKKKISEYEDNNENNKQILESILLENKKIKTDLENEKEKNIKNIEKIKIDNEEKYNELFNSLRQDFAGDQIRLNEELITMKNLNQENSNLILDYEDKIKKLNLNLNQLKENESKLKNEMDSMSQLYKSDIEELKEKIHEKTRLKSPNYNVIQTTNPNTILSTIKVDTIVDSDRNILSKKISSMSIENKSFQITSNDYFSENQIAKNTNNEINFNCDSRCKFERKSSLNIITKPARPLSPLNFIGDCKRQINLNNNEIRFSNFNFEDVQKKLKNFERQTELIISYDQFNIESNKFANKNISNIEVEIDKLKSENEILKKEINSLNSKDDEVIVMKKMNDKLKKDLEENKNLFNELKNNFQIISEKKEYQQIVFNLEIAEQKKIISGLREKLEKEEASNYKKDNEILDSQNTLNNYIMLKDKLELRIQDYDSRVSEMILTVDRMINSSEIDEYNSVENYIKELEEHNTIEFDSKIEELEHKLLILEIKKKPNNDDSSEEKYKQEIIQLNENIADKEERINEMKYFLTEKEQEVIQLKEKHAQIEEEYQMNLDSMKENYNSLNVNLSLENNRLLMEINNLENVNNELLNQIKLKEEKYSQIKTDILIIEEKKKEIEETLSKTLLKHEDEVRLLIQENNEIRGCLNSMKGVEKKNKDLLKELESMNKKFEELLEEKQKVILSNKAIESRLTSIEDEFNEFRFVSRNCADENISLKMNLVEIKEKLEKIVKSIKLTERLNPLSIRENIEFIEFHISRISDKNSTLLNENQANLHQFEILSKNYETLFTTTLSFEEKFYKLNETVEILALRIQGYENLYKELIEKYKNTVNSKIEVDEELNKLILNETNAKKQINELELEKLENSNKLKSFGIVIQKLNVENIELRKLEIEFQELKNKYGKSSNELEININEKQVILEKNEDLTRKLKLIENDILNKSLNLSKESQLSFGLINEFTSLSFMRRLETLVNNDENILISIIQKYEDKFKVIMKNNDNELKDIIHKFESAKNEINEIKINQNELIQINIKKTQEIQGLKLELEGLKLDNKEKTDLLFKNSEQLTTNTEYIVVTGEYLELIQIPHMNIDDINTIKLDNLELKKVNLELINKINELQKSLVDASRHHNDVSSLHSEDIYILNEDDSLRDTNSKLSKKSKKISDENEYLNLIEKLSEFSQKMFVDNLLLKKHLENSISVKDITKIIFKRLSNCLNTVFSNQEKSCLSINFLEELILTMNIEYLRKNENKFLEQHEKISLIDQKDFDEEFINFVASKVYKNNFMKSQLKQLKNLGESGKMNEIPNEYRFNLKNLDSTIQEQLFSLKTYPTVAKHFNSFEIINQLKKKYREEKKSTIDLIGSIINNLKSRMKSGCLIINDKVIYNFTNTIIEFEYTNTKQLYLINPIDSKEKIDRFSLMLRNDFYDMNHVTLSESLNDFSLNLDKLVNSILNNCNKLRSIILTKNHFSLTQFSTIGRIFEFTRIEELVLKSNFLTDEMVVVLISKIFNNYDLRTLDLTNNLITSIGTLEICRYLRVNQKLEKLILSGNSINSKGLFEISETLTKNNCTLSCLSISENAFCVEDAKFICKLFKENTSLKFLNLSCFPFKNETILQISKALTFSANLNILVLDNTDLKGVVFSSFFKYFNMNKLTEIHLNGNPLNQQEIQVLTETLILNKNLKLISLRNCGLDYKKIMLLIKLMNCKTIETIDLRENEICLDGESVNKLINCFSQKSKFKVLITRPKFKDQSEKSLSNSGKFLIFI